MMKVSIAHCLSYFIIHPRNRDALNSTLFNRRVCIRKFREQSVPGQNSVINIGFIVNNVPCNLKYLLIKSNLIKTLE